jgi:hypothetical protein
MRISSTPPTPWPPVGANPQNTLKRVRCCGPFHSSLPPYTAKKRGGCARGEGRTLARGRVWRIRSKSLLSKSNWSVRVKAGHGLSSPSCKITGRREHLGLKHRCLERWLAVIGNGRYYGGPAARQYFAFVQVVLAHYKQPTCFVHLPLKQRFREPSSVSLRLFETAFQCNEDWSERR